MNGYPSASANRYEFDLLDRVGNGSNPPSCPDPGTASAA